jgi:NAD(P)-dependent dehydrogenase (short-subunit alcohol dehydrogenase family)
VEKVSLDVTSNAEVASVAARLRDSGERLTALVNNAGTSFKGFDADLADRTLQANFFGPMRVTDGLLSALEPNARIVMVSSGMGELSGIGPEMRGRFDPPPALDGLVALTREFVDDVRRGDHESRGWPSNAYRVSKVALNALTRLYAEALSESHPDVKINAVCPGWVRTRMGGPNAHRSVEQGAQGIVWAATLPTDGPTGGFFRDAKRITW